MDAIRQDIRYALRRLLKSPGFAAIAVVTLALGIGANSAIFSVVNGVLLGSLPFEEPDRLAMVWLDNQRMGVRTDITSYPTYRDWREQSRTFQDMAAYSSGEVNISGEFEPERVNRTSTTGNFFSVMGVSPERGRSYTEEEQEAGAQVVVIGHGLWQRRFGGDPDAVGQMLRLGGQEYTVLGVMPAGFDFPADAEIWMPLSLSDDIREARFSFWLYVAGRLRPDASIEVAQREMEAINARILEEYPQAEGLGVYVQSVREHLVGDVRPALLVLLGAVGFVLLIACVNVANLLLARAAAREREMAVRAALGAGRGRLTRQLLTESVVVAVTGGALGLLLAIWGVDALRAMAPADLPRMDQVGLDGYVLGFTLLLSVATGVLFGLAPALQSVRVELTRPLKEGGRGASGGRGGGRVRAALVVSEIAIALVLLIGAGLLIQSFARLQGVDTGFESGGVLTARIAPSGSEYQEAGQVRGFYQELLQRVDALPGVVSAAAGSEVLLAQLPWSANVTAEGQPSAPPEEQIEVTIDAVTPGFFRTVGTPLLRGRGIEASDREGGDLVAVINEAMARRFWADGDPVGQRFKFGDEDSESPWRTVVGVVGDARRTAPDRDARPSAYMPHSQLSVASMMVVVRTAGDPLTLAGPIREAVRAIDRDVPVTRLATLETILRDRLAQRRLITTLVGAFSALALILAMIGVYGVISYTVAQSSRELGIRMALGASSITVLALVARRLGLLVLAGVAIGLVGAVLATRTLGSMLYGVAAVDPATFTLGPLVLAAVAAVASYIPARRATRVDPVVVLRDE